MASFETRVDEALELFSFFDQDSSGDVDFGELTRCLAHLGIKKSDTELKKLISRVDNGDGKISPEEFCQMLQLCNDDDDSVTMDMSLYPHVLPYVEPTSSPSKKLSHRPFEP